MSPVVATTLGMLTVMALVGNTSDGVVTVPTKVVGPDTVSALPNVIVPTPVNARDPALLNPPVKVGGLVKVGVIEMFDVAEYVVVPVCECVAVLKVTFERLTSVVFIVTAESAKATEDRNLSYTDAYEV